MGHARPHPPPLSRAPRFMVIPHLSPLVTALDAVQDGRMVELRFKAKVK
jgi:hypothetical protein